MVERNMIREGFIRNTANSPTDPTFSGSQLLDEQQMTVMADGAISVPAVTVSATESIVLTADLGARWKLNRIELYTEDASTAEMAISDDDIAYFPVTLTGSPNLYVGDIADSTISGAPRYIRYTHAPSGDVDTFEWKAINDDTLVDFGADGNQTEVEIEDAPVGRPSDNVQILKLFNRFPKKGSAFVFIDDTGTDADELFEISTSTNGPWFGRQVLESSQPAVTSWAAGTLQGTRTVTSSGFYHRWSDSQDVVGWGLSALSFREFTLDGAAGYTSTGLGPSFINVGDYTDGEALLMSEPAGIGNILGPHNNHVLIDTDLYDRVRVRMRGGPLGVNDVSEGPRLRWRWVEDAGGDPYPVENSVLSQFPYNNLSGEIQDFIFDVGSVTTWSGAPFHTVRGLSVQPFTAVTGTAIDVDFFEIEAFHSSGADRVVLERRTVASGIRPSMVNDGTSFHRQEGVTLSLNTRIKEPCIITKIMSIASLANTTRTGCFLFRFDEDNPQFNFPSASGTNFIVKNTAQYQQIGGQNPVSQEAFVFWKAAPGDFIGYSSEENNADVWYSPQSPGALTWRADASDPGNGSILLNDAATCQEDLNFASTWVSEATHLTNIWFESIPIGDYLATGTYTTPVFDGGSQPSLVSSSFTSIETRESSIDSDTASAFKTIRARASDTPPISSPVIGQELIRSNWGSDSTYPTNQLSTALGVYPTAKWLNEEEYASGGNDWIINQNNGFVTSREVAGTNTIKNLGGAMMYHPDNDELWVLNVLLSGTAPSDLRPIWDVYDPNSFEYMRTDHLQGQINYSYEAAVTATETFEPVGMIWDAAFDEIHIVQRQPYFFVNTVIYYAITMDTQGNFLRSSWREDSIGGSSTRWNNMSCLTFDGTYFYALTSDTVDSSSGDLLMVIQRGDLVTEDNTLVSESVVIDLSTIPGMSEADGNPNAMQCVYNPIDGLLYLFFGNPLNSVNNSANRRPEMYALRVVLVAGTLVSVTKVDLVDPRGVSVRNGVSLAELGMRRSGFSGTSAAGSDATELLSDRQLLFLAASTYDSERESFNLLQCREAQFSEDYDIQIGDRINNNRRYDHKTIQFMYSCSAGPDLEYAITPVTPRGIDPVWGALSGTLAYDSLQEGSVLFPTGRYAQVQYTLTSSPDHTTSPQLVTSQLDQGLRVGLIPASGTTDLYLRTDIPEGQSLGDQTGNLKVFWELPN